MTAKVITIGSLFSGIGGLELGLELATGAKTIWQVEADPFCRRVLAKHWPQATRYDDVCTTRSLPFVDIVCGGFPCQDISLAGKGAGIEHGERSGLWREFARIVKETQPRVVVVENVAALARRGLARVLRDLTDLGFVGTWDVVSAAEVGAPHLRRRLFVVAAHPERVELRDEQRWRSGACWSRARGLGDDGASRPAADADLQHLEVSAQEREHLSVATRTGEQWTTPHPDGDAGGQGRAGDGSKGPRGRDAGRGTVGPDDANAHGAGREEQHAAAVAEGARLCAGRTDAGWCGWVAASAVRRVDDGFSAGLDRPRRRRRPANDRHRLHALGNAVVPQVAEVVGVVVANILRIVR